MRVQCDVCGQEPAAVLCCADEAALCSACDRRVHRANRLAGKHRRLPLLHPSLPTNDSDTAAPPLCDVCKDRRGLVFCVEDRAILCADCDEPIHSANELTAKHSRFLLVGAKLSAALVDQAIPSPDGSSDELHNLAACAAEDSSLDASHGGGGGGGGGGGSSISDYLTNICPGWRVEDLLLDDDAAAAAAAAAAKGRDEQVPFLDADLSDVVAGRPEKRGAWAPHVPQTPAPAWGLEKVPAALAAPAAAKAKQGHVRERHWSDSDAFAVPEISPSPAKRARPSSFWCF